MTMQLCLRYISQLHAWMRTATDAYPRYASKMHSCGRVFGPFHRNKRGFFICISWTTEMCALHSYYHCNSLLIIYWLSTKLCRKQSIHLAVYSLLLKRVPPHGDSLLFRMSLLSDKLIFSINRSNIHIKHI